MSRDLSEIDRLVLTILECVEVSCRQASREPGDDADRIADCLAATQEATRRIMQREGQ